MECNSLKLKPFIVSKTKELLVVFRRHSTHHSLITIEGAAVVVVNCFRFLVVQLSSGLTWSHNTASITSKAQQCLYFLSHLRKFGVGSPLVNLYRATRESLLTACITVWYGTRPIRQMVPLYSDSDHQVQGQFLPPGCLHPEQTLSNNTQLETTVFHCHVVYVSKGCLLHVVKGCHNFVICYAVSCLFCTVSLCETTICE